MHIVIIGAGNIGSRHLQALALLELPNINISVVDPSNKSLEIAKARFLEVQKNNNIKRIKFLQNLEQIDHNIDIAIIATNSDVRKFIIEKLVNIKSIKYLILEKVLFQKVDDFKEIKEVLNTNSIKCWVNCPRRIFSFYIELKKILSSYNIYEVNVSGSNWGLGSNSIHFIDLVSYLTECSDYNIKLENLNILDSKREGFIEFTGTVTANFKNGTKLTLKSYTHGNLPILINIVTEKRIFFIDEINGKMFSYNHDKNSKWELIDFVMPYQSQITNLIVKEIFETGNCKLTTYDESIKLHLPMIESFLAFLKNFYKKEMILCPIT